jgi:hypothetical protein
MKRILNSIAPLILGFTFIVSMATTGCAARAGVYDPEYRDYHRWRDDEDRAYHRYWDDDHPREHYRE